MCEKYYIWNLATCTCENACDFVLKQRRKLLSASKKENRFEKKKKVTRHITDNLEISSDDSNESDQNGSLHEKRKMFSKVENVEDYL